MVRVYTRVRVCVCVRVSVGGADSQAQRWSAPCWLTRRRREAALPFPARFPCAPWGAR